MCELEDHWKEIHAVLHICGLAIEKGDLWDQATEMQRRLLDVLNQKPGICNGAKVIALFELLKVGVREINLDSKAIGEESSTIH